MIISTVFNAKPKPLKIQTDTLYASKTSNDIVAVVSISVPWVNIAAISGEQITGYNWALKLADFEDQYTVFTGEVNLRNKV